jgi:hypothetical protein
LLHIHAYKDPAGKMQNGYVSPEKPWKIQYFARKGCRKREKLVTTIENLDTM